MLVFPDMRLQDEEWDCGRASVRAVLSLFGRMSPPGFAYGIDLALANPVQGMCPSTMEATIRAYGIPILSGHMRVKDLGWFTRTGRPVLCPIADYYGHWVVVAGVERGFVHFFDPSKGMTRRRADKWEQAWKDQDSKGHAYVNWGIAAG